MSVKIFDKPEIQDFLQVLSGMKNDDGNPRVKQIVHRLMSDLFRAIDDLNITPDEYWIGVAWLGANVVFMLCKVTERDACVQHRLSNISYRTGMIQDVRAYYLGHCRDSAAQRLFAALRHAGKGMDLRQLRYFIAVARERNFTRAAEALNMAQPPLSRQIQTLEEELGVPLLLRDTRPVRLTDAGRLFYEQAMQILSRVEQMQAATRRVGMNRSSVLSIGFVPSTLYGGLPTLVRNLRQLAPHLDIQLLEMVSVLQTPALKEGRIDVGFGRLRNSDPAITSIVLREERLCVAIPQGHALAEDTTALPVTELSGQRLIIYPKEPRPSYADQVLNILHEHGVQSPEVQEVREIQTALGLVAAAAGVCIIPASARQMRSDVYYRVIENPDATSPVILNHRAGDESDVIDLVKQQIRKMYAENPPWLDFSQSKALISDYPQGIYQP